jgi:hypothetical protein
MDRDAFVRKLFDDFAENFPDLADEHRQIVKDEIETAIFNEESLGDLKYDESGLARIEYAIMTAFDRLGVPEVSEDDE